VRLSIVKPKKQKTPVGVGAEGAGAEELVEELVEELPEAESPPEGESTPGEQ